MSTLVTVPTKHRTSESEFFRLNIGTSDIGHFTRIGRTLLIFNQKALRVQLLAQAENCVLMSFMTFICIVFIHLSRATLARPAKPISSYYAGCLCPSLRSLIHSLVLNFLYV